ncbi:MAG TPA: hypothetical protein QF905_09775 [Acidimicrobiales bacterium]|jgi:hypothetical protein|nr:hypothetical protein [Acidimicrobiales bacterium]MDP7209347.1 hypothetical protein [Acidimicrobiales bacterium]HJL90604.1 hypothetical protein [Acidimicrobiales bacterium]HJO99726.1 hypothetical protein [Acidimicrobiales bacterium]|tara:strand:- start:1111 stop:1350 length:240 start_codon:yes stop_codon:yes gene_type:complete
MLSSTAPPELRLREESLIADSERLGSTPRPPREVHDGTGDTWTMGLSPKRYRQSKPSDLVYVGSVVVVAVILVAWALFG